MALSINSPVDSFQEVLKREGFEVSTSTNGTEALDLIMSELPDAAVLDANLPRLDAFEILDTMKQSESTRKIPVIIYSHTDSVENREKAMDHEARDFVVGDTESVEDIVLKLKSYLGKQKAYTFDLSSDIENGEKIARDLGCNSISCPFCKEIMSLYLLRDLGAGKNTFKISLICPECSFKHGAD